MNVGENVYLRLARRDWRCRVCKAVLPRGAHYLECVDSVAAFQSGDRYCLPCGREQLGTMVDDWPAVERAAIRKATTQENG